jgi:hypothetical protein
MIDLQRRFNSRIFSRFREYSGIFNYQAKTGGQKNMLKNRVLERKNAEILKKNNKISNSNKQNATNIKRYIGFRYYLLCSILFICRVDLWI